MVRLHLAEIKEHAPAELKRLTGAEVRVLEQEADEAADLIVEVGPHDGKSVLLLEAKSSGSTNQVAAAVTQLKTYLRRLPANHFGVVVVPYMGEAGQRVCEENGISWFDLSGNAEISARGLRIRFRGRPNKYKRRGRPRSLFASSGTRIARTLLLDPTQKYTRRELSRAARVAEGHTGNLVRRYLREDLVAEDERRRVYCPNPGLLLDSWREEYDFFRHRVVYGHLSVRGTGPELSQTVQERLTDLSCANALTGLAAAWTYDHFATFRLATVFVGRAISIAEQKQIGFREVEKGANVWLVLPEDDGVFDGCRVVEGKRLVHPVQVYVDLKDHPERSAEAAQSLRESCQELRWSVSA